MKRYEELKVARRVERSPNEKMAREARVDLPPSVPTVFFEGTLSEDDLKEVLQKRSPGPFKAVIGRDLPQPKRIDIMSSDGSRTAHFHVVDPKNEATPNFAVDAKLIVHLLNSLEEKPNG